MPMNQLVSAVTGSWGYIAVTALPLVAVGHYLHRRRTAQPYNWALVEQVNGPLGVDGRRLTDTGCLLQRTRQAGLETRLHISGLPRGIPPAVDLAGYRIIQEALTSAIEHGMPAATVEISYEATLVTLIVDSPIGNRPARPSGLSRMRERARTVGGIVEAGPYRGGWRVTAYLPIEPEPS